MTTHDGNPEIVTQDMIDVSEQIRKGNWLKCAFCGHHFTVGQTMRFVLSPLPFFGNFYVCTACDGPNEALFARGEALVEELYRRFAWAVDDEDSLHYHWSRGKIVRPYYHNPEAR